MWKPPGGGHLNEGAYRRRMDVDPIRKATAATLRQVSQWGLAFDGSTIESTRDELLAIANQVDELNADNDMCCPVCEEVTCDKDCPLSPMRVPGGE